MKVHASELPIKASFTLALPQPKVKPVFGMECDLFRGELQTLLDKLETTKANNKGYVNTYIDEVIAPWQQKIRKKILKGVKLARKTSDKKFHRLLVTAHITTMNGEDINNPKIYQIKNLEKQYDALNPQFRDLNSKWLRVVERRKELLEDKYTAETPSQKEELLASWGMGKKDLDELRKQLDKVSEERIGKLEEIDRLKDQLASEYWGAS